VRLFPHYLSHRSLLTPYSISAANAAGKFLTDKFYVDYRMAGAFAFEGTLPKILSFKEWEACKSTKMDTTAHIIQHHLKRDDAPQVTYLDE